jgi:hypothetical protein
MSWQPGELRTELMTAIAHGRVAAVKKLLDAAGTSTVLCIRGLLPLAARSGQDGLCEMLLELGVPVDDREDETGNFTALMWAAANVEANLVRLLLRHGANPLLKTQAGGAPPQPEPGTAADLSQLKLESKLGDPTWTRCANECIAILHEAAFARRLRTRRKLQRAIRLVLSLLAWRMRAAVRAYSPGGAGYHLARDDFDVQCEAQQQQQQQQQPSSSPRNEQSQGD